MCIALDLETPASGKVLNWAPLTWQSWGLVPLHAPGGVALQGSDGDSHPTGLISGLWLDGASPFHYLGLAFLIHKGEAWPRSAPAPISRGVLSFDGSTLFWGLNH